MEYRRKEGIGDEEQTLLKRLQETEGSVLPYFGDTVIVKKYKIKNYFRTPSSEMSLKAKSPMELLTKPPSGNVFTVKSRPIKEWYC